MNLKLYSIRHTDFVNTTILILSDFTTVIKATVNDLTLDENVKTNGASA